MLTVAHMTFNHGGDGFESLLVHYKRKEMHNIKVGDRQTARSITTGAENIKYKYLVSLYGEGEMPPPCIYDQRRYQDVFPWSCWDVWYARNLEDYKEAPTFRDTQRYVSWATSVAKDKVDHNVFLHCQAGVSRSTACAYILMCLERGEGNERDALDHLMKIRPIAHPNPWILYWAAKLMPTFDLWTPLKDRFGELYLNFESRATKLVEEYGVRE